MADPNSVPDWLGDEVRAAAPRGPSPDKLAEITAAGADMRSAEADVARLESDLKDAKGRLNRLAHRVLPDLMSEIGVDVIGIPGLDLDVINKNYYSANISAEWDDERRERAFAWLEANGFGSVVKHDVTFSFRRGEEAKVRWVVDLVVRAAERHSARLAETASLEGRDLRPDETWDIPVPTVRKNVPHATLKSIVRTQHELPADDPGKKVLPLDVLGAVVGRMVVLKPRDSK